jgi:hypothetical protein
MDVRKVVVLLLSRTVLLGWSQSMFLAAAVFFLSPLSRYVKIEERSLLGKD